MTYNVFGGTLSLTQSINQSLWLTWKRVVHFLLVLFNFFPRLSISIENRCYKQMEGVTMDDQLSNVIDALTRLRGYMSDIHRIPEMLRWAYILLSFSFHRIFTALYWMHAMRILSVCLSVCQTHALWQTESVRILNNYIRLSIYTVSTKK